ncbi:MAG: sodium:calcium antiporter [bacterium]
MDVFIQLFDLTLVLAFIVVICVIFTNAIEHLGEKLNLSEGAVGSVLAAVGTALPETIVPVVAILGAYFAGADLQKSNDIGIGAILGAPFMLGTLAFFVTGAAVYIYAKKGRRTLDMPVDTVVMFRDLHYFAFSFILAVGASFLPSHKLKIFVAVALLFMYGLYVFKTLKKAITESEGGEEELAALYFTKYIKTSPALEMPAIIVQLIFSLIGLIVLAHVFVGHLTNLAEIMKIPPLILSLILTPIATELPEKLNSILWIRSKKDTLALGNITGAMVFQSCIPTALGIILTPWVLNEYAVVNVIVVYLSVIVVYLNIVKNKGILKPNALIMGGLFYLIYFAFVLVKMYCH